MPELPEVEVVRRQLEPLLVGRTIAVVRATGASYFFLSKPRELAQRLTGRVVRGVARRGKYLLAELDDDSRLLLHLGMTGQLFTAGASSLRLLSAARRSALAPEEQPDFRPDAHTHLVLSFRDGGPELLFRDVRRFGKVLWLAPGQSHPRLERLGDDALGVRGDALFAATRKRTAPIKSVLLDQRIVAGVGNIYADEALFLAGVRPARRAGRLSRAECDRIADSVVAVLLRSIETGGSSISDYVAPDGRDGAYQDERRVYSRTGEPCRVCDAKVRRRVIGQRSSHYCPSCQR